MSDPNEQPSNAPRVDPRRVEHSPRRDGAEPIDDAPRDGPAMTLRGAPITIALMIVNIAIELALVVNPAWRDYAISHYAFGMLYDQGVLRATLGEAVITHAFLHGGLLHLGFNMAALAAFGPPVERSIGSLPYAAIYAMAAVAGALAHYGWLTAEIAFGLPPHEGALQILVGASGAISGVLALEFRRRAILMAYAAGRPFTGGYVRQTAATFILINVAISLLPGFISGEAHIGGFLVGLILGPLILRRARL